ncbi:TPA: SEC10/PgrA surface exclusion domain-containing protein, partial [Streptococcus suis]|nr:SEC10/PgrA surface exclusion domain-containing protein [Streptococcus suis]
MAKKSIIGTSVVALSLLSAGTVAANTGVESTDSTNVTPSSVSAETADNSLNSTTAATSSELETPSTDIKYGTITETVNTDTVDAEKIFPVSTEFGEALKEREELIDRLMYGENPGSVQGVTVTPLDKASVENTTNRETLLNEGTQLMESNSYVPSSNTIDDEAVDILNITEEQRKELNLFATEIINAIREQVGTSPVVTTQGMFNVANAVTNKINEVEASKPDRSGEKWDFNTEAHLYYTGYHYDAIYDAAVANGLRVETTKYPNTVAKNFGYQTEVSSGEYKDQKQSDMIVIKQDIVPSDILTMGQLKALVYDGFEKMIYKPSFASNINDDKTVTSRDYDHALGVTGLRRYRAEDYQPNTHVSTAITFIRQPWGDGVRKYTAQLHIFQESGNLQSDNYKNLKGSLAGIVDPTLYDKTPLTRTIITGVPTQAPVVELPEAKEEKVIFDPNNKDHIEKIEDPTLPLGKEVIESEGKDGIDFVIKFGDQKTRYVKIALEKRVVRVGTLVTSEVTPEQPTGESSG